MVIIIPFFYTNFVYSTETKILLIHMVKTSTTLSTEYAGNYLLGLCLVSWIGGYVGTGGTVG
jgi:hypothetical protein